MCAGAQGRFWEMHDALFDAQAEWAKLDNAVPVFERVAGAAGVDVARMRACLGAKTMQGIVQEDYDRSVRAGVQSTPTFIVDRATLSGVYPIERFRAVIDSVLKARGQPRP
jgi:protein-disulfide isomerase